MTIIANPPKWYISISLIIIGVILNILMFVITIPLLIWRFIEGNKNFNLYLARCAWILSQIGNVYHDEVFNTFFWKKSGAKSGDIDESISSVAGKNEYMSTLKPLGRALVWLLDKFDANHSIDAIENDEGDLIRTL